MLTKIADFYDEEVDAAVESLLAAMEPIMIVFLGVVVGGMIVAMYLPMSLIYPARRWPEGPGCHEA
jgi:type IV pilus assembly protein PilC